MAFDPILQAGYEPPTLPYLQTIVATIAGQELFFSSADGANPVKSISLTIPRAVNIVLGDFALSIVECNQSHQMIYKIYKNNEVIYEQNGNSDEVISGLVLRYQINSPLVLYSTDVIKLEVSCNGSYTGAGFGRYTGSIALYGTFI